jgi:hypothetical protein
METAGVEPTTSSLQARRSATRASSPMRTGGVEPPQREAAGLQSVELADAQRPRLGGLGLLNWGGRTDSNRYLRGSQPRMLRYTTATMIITGTTGLEPASSRLTSERSARLSYAPESKIAACPALPGMAHCGLN